MNILTLDVETTISNRGHFADSKNKLVMVGLKVCDTQSISTCFNVLEDNHRHLIQSIINNSDLIVGFNIKFDLHWLKNYGIDFSHKRIWDCQLAEFIFESQQNKYPSLNDTLAKYGLPPKLDAVASDYWDKGIDTDKIPANILSEYLKRDLEATEEVFLIQRDLFKTKHKDKYKLFQLQCADLLVLQDMEYNGMRFDSEEALEASKEVDKELEDIRKEIKEAFNVPEDCMLNLGSNDHVSAILYGGIITQKYREPCGVYKTGQKVGQIRYRVLEKTYTFPRVVEPLERSESKKSIDKEEELKYYSVAEDVLSQLKCDKKARHLVGLIQRHSKLEKLKGTYLEGFCSLIEEMNWPKNMIHGSLNQCSVVTGRLSSTRPNLQNVDPYTKKFFKTRYDL